MFMVNGTLSKIIYIGAYALAALCVAGIIVLTVDGRTAPADLETVLFALLGMIVGTHITPPTVQKTTVGTVEPASVYTAAHHDHLVPPTPIAVVAHAPAVNVATGPAGPTGAQGERGPAGPAGPAAAPKDMNA